MVVPKWGCKMVYINGVNLKNWLIMGIKYHRTTDMPRTNLQRLLLWFQETMPLQLLLRPSRMLLGSKTCFLFYFGEKINLVFGKES